MNTAKVENKDLPAFASVAISGNDGYQQDGLTKREYFAAMAMQALLSNPNIKRPEQNANLKNDLKVFASIAVEYADAVLAEL